ncbi:MAG: hypothetical protein JWM88_3504 [Verrucomicrobia bacterium]|nr:hypothetical protein [Verrucomicrobiota bacterium]
MPSTEENHQEVCAPSSRNAGRILAGPPRAEDSLEFKTKQLELSVSLMRATLEATSDGILVTDTHGQVSDLNSKFSQMWRLSPAASAIKSHQQLMELIAPQLSRPAQFLEALQEIAMAAPAQTVHVLECIDGRVLERHSNLQRLRDEPVGRVWSFRDITARWQAERTGEVRERLASMVESSDDAILSKTLEGIITTWNKGAERMFGYTADEIVGKSIYTLIPLDRASEEETIIARLKRGERLEHYETIRRRKDGSLIDVSLMVSPMRDSAGKIIGASKIARDVTAQKQAEAALREEYAIVEDLNTVARTLASELDPAKIVQTITDAGTRITRAAFGAFFYNKTDDSGASYMLYTLSGASREAFDKFPMPRATEIFGPTFRGEGVVRLADVTQDPRFGRNLPYHGLPPGHLPVVSYLAVPVIARSGEVLGGLFFGHPSPGVFKERDERIVVALAAQAAAAMDMAKLYLAEQRARNAAEEASRTKDDFLAALSHELRTPLTPVLAILSNLAEDPSVPPALGSELETVRRNVELETRLIDDLLDMTRVTRGKLELHRERVAVADLIEDAVNTCFADLEAKHLVLVRDLEHPRQRIHVDSARITQVLWNLLKNSIKFTPPGGTVTIRLRVRPQNAGVSPAAPPTAEDRGQVSIAVEDTGIGIAPDQLNRVFDAFEQGGRKITRQFGGLGLGLTISKAIADAHQGDLTAASAGPSHGSTFTLSLPCRPGEEDAPSAAAIPPASATPPAKMERGRILLVEDHADTATVIVRLLARNGYDLVHASTVAAALAMAETEMKGRGLDLVISDVGLPDGSGQKLMKTLASKYGLRGIALSGFGMDADLEQSLAAGFSHHLTKPININSLRATIAEMLQ